MMMRGRGILRLIPMSVALRACRRANSYNNFADDESSDSSASGLLEGIGIQGTFPSAERIRVR